MKDKYNVGINENANSQDDSSIQPVKTREEILGKRKFLKKTNTIEVDSTMLIKKPTLKLKEGIMPLVIFRKQQLEYLVDF